MAQNLRYANLPKPFSHEELTRLADLLISVQNSASIGSEFDVDRLLMSFDAIAKPRAYTTVHPDQEAAFNAVLQASPRAAAACLKLALVKQLIRFAEQDRLRFHPKSIQEQYEIHLALVRQALESRPDTYYSLTNDVYFKDLALISERMLPGGAQLIQTFWGVPRSLLWRGGGRQALAFGAFLVARLKRLVPLFDMHTDPRRMSEFTPAGWERFYLRVAEVLQCRPEIRGLTGASWWYDPLVPKMSPQLAFLHEVPLRHGAQVFRYETSASAKELALLRSPERQAAYDRGEYIPTTYVLTWPREDLLRWAEKHGFENT